jgi:hypothetical protein
MVEAGTVSVLLVTDDAKAFSLSLRLLEESGCKCHFAKSKEDIAKLLEHGQFDIVLSTRMIRGTATAGLGGLLWGKRSSLFFAMRVENGCWWLPVLRHGENCFGTPALSASVFISVLDDLIREIRNDSYLALARPIISLRTIIHGREA